MAFLKYKRLVKSTFWLSFGRKTKIPTVRLKLHLVIDFVIRVYSSHVAHGRRLISTKVEITK